MLPSNLCRLILFALHLLIPIASQADKRGITEKDLFDFLWIGDPQISPDGSRVAWFHDFIVMLIWSVHASGTSVSSYRNFFLQAFGNVSQLLWLLKGSISRRMPPPADQRPGTTQPGKPEHKTTCE